MTQEEANREGLRVMGLLTQTLGPRWDLLIMEMGVGYNPIIRNSKWKVSVSPANESGVGDWVCYLDDLPNFPSIGHRSSDPVETVQKVQEVLTEMFKILVGMGFQEGACK
ncbi:MAG: hypothetical protein ACYTEQ_01175 [Planctomycetota bacterium]|jgi:hypothetical protein